MMDAYTRRVLAFFITFDAPSYRSDMMVIRECVRRFNRLPQTIVTDNGRDFKSVYFQSLLSYFRITIKYRPAHKARFGSVGERLFGTTMTQLIHNLQGNTEIMKKVRQVSKSVNPTNFTVWTLPTLYVLLQKYFYEFYDVQEHTSLGESPREAFERGILLSGKRPFRFIPYNEEFIILTLPPVKRNDGYSKVDSQRGVKVNYFYYHCNEFSNLLLNGTKVPARYDPMNVGIIYCYINNKWTLCRSEYFSVFNRRTEKEIELISQKLIKQKSNHAGKSAISARELADFITKAEATEEILNQQFRDMEVISQLSVINNSEPLNVNEKEPLVKSENIDIG